MNVGDTAEIYAWFVKPKKQYEVHDGRRVPITVNMLDLEKLEIGPLVSNIKGLMNQLSKNNAHVRYKNNIVKFRKKVFKNENCFENIVKIIN